MISFWNIFMLLKIPDILQVKRYSAFDSKRSQQFSCWQQTSTLYFNYLVNLDWSVVNSYLSFTFCNTIVPWVCHELKLSWNICNVCFIAQELSYWISCKVRDVVDNRIPQTNLRRVKCSFAISVLVALHLRNLFSHLVQASRH